VSAIREAGRVHVITDCTVQTQRTHIDLAGAALAGGAGVIQLRDKVLPDAALELIAREIVPLCVQHNALLIVNDRIDVARAAGAHGVHLGQDDAPVGAARAALGTRAVVGASASTLDEALEAEAAGADYIGFGHVFPTTTKATHAPPAGLDGLRAVCAVVHIPVIAIGGIDAVRAARCVAMGAFGVAVVSAVCAAENPTDATRRIVRGTQA